MATVYTVHHRIRIDLEFYLRLRLVTFILKDCGYLPTPQEGGVKNNRALRLYLGNLEARKRHSGQPECETRFRQILDCLGPGRLMFVVSNTHSITFHNVDRSQ